MWETSLSLPAAHTGFLFSKEELLDNPRSQGGGGQLALRPECLLMPRSRKTKSGAILASRAYKSRQLTSSQGEFIWTQPPFHQALSPKTLPGGPAGQPRLAPHGQGLGCWAWGSRWLCFHQPPLDPHAHVFLFLRPIRLCCGFG